MNYRTLGRTEFKVSEIGLGTEYLIDLPRDHVISVIKKAFENGINYFDVFFAQPAFRDNMGAAFAGIRDQVFLAAHIGSTHPDGQYAMTRDIEASSAYFQDFLDRYDTDYADVAFLHNCDPQEDYDKVFCRGGQIDLAKEYKASGRARAIGFSGHTVETSIQAVETGLIDVLMYPVSIANNSVPGRQRLLETCSKNHVGIVAMKIFGGGKLLDGSGKAELERAQMGGEGKTLAHSASLNPVQGMHYALSQVGISAIVPGCKNLDELAADLAYIDSTDAEKDYAASLADISQFDEGECVYCNHCLPCPSEIDIGKTIRLTEMSKAGYGKALEEYLSMQAKGENCIECGDCESRCPFGVKTVSKVLEAADVFGA